MGKNINHDLISFFESKLSQHGKVTSFTRIDGDNDNYRIYSIQRKNLSSLRIVMADEYNFTETELNLLPPGIKSGDIVYLADPNGHISAEAFRQGKEREIFVGGFGTVYGALNPPRPWSYVPPEERKKKKSS